MENKPLTNIYDALVLARKLRFQHLRKSKLKKQLHTHNHLLTTYLKLKLSELKKRLKQF